MKNKEPFSFRRPLYGRRNGPSLGASRRALFEDRMAHFCVVPFGTSVTALNLAELFPETRRIWLEIGFGAGEHLAATAKNNADLGMIGCEHYLAGVASCLSKLDQQEVENARVYRGDARDLMDALPDNSIERAFLLYPDPWPKTRHHKRRFINDETVSSFARILIKAGELSVASDIPDYIEWTEGFLAKSNEFAPIHQSEADIKAPWEGWTQTRYEAKALREGRSPAYLRYRRI